MAFKGYICLVLMPSSQSGRGREKKEAGTKMAWLTGNYDDGRLDCAKDQMAQANLASTLWGLSQHVKSSPLSLPSRKLQAGKPW